MSKTPENPSEWLDHYERLRAKAEQTYQETGANRYYNAEYQYRCICDAFRALIKQAGEQKVDMAKRMRCRDAVIDRLLNPTYTKEEVIKMLNDAVWW